MLNLRAEAENCFIGEPLLTMRVGKYISISNQYEPNHPYKVLLNIMKYAQF